MILYYFTCYNFNYPIELHHRRLNPLSRAFPRGFQFHLQFSSIVVFPRMPETFFWRGVSSRLPFILINLLKKKNSAGVRKNGYVYIFSSDLIYWLELTEVTFSQSPKFVFIWLFVIIFDTFRFFQLHPTKLEFYLPKSLDFLPHPSCFVKWTITEWKPFPYRKAEPVDCFNTIKFCSFFR